MKVTFSCENMLLNSTFINWLYETWFDNGTHTDLCFSWLRWGKVDWVDLIYELWFITLKVSFDWL